MYFKIEAQILTGWKNFNNKMGWKKYNLGVMGMY